MKTIRKSVFETNSSSTHSISVADNGPLKNGLECVDGYVQIELGLFDWEVKEYNDTYTKLSYLMTFIFQDFPDYKKDDIDWRKFNRPGNSRKSYWNKLQDVVREFTGCQIVIALNDSFHPFGYIDHQSYEVAGEILRGSKSRIKRFLFNPRSVLRTDNDNRADYYK